jgi:predicted transcriptional regulator
VPRRPVAAKRPPGAKRPPAELAKLTEKLGEYIKENPGLRMEAIARALATPTRELNLPIKKLLASKKIRFEGHKRATEYFPT